MPDRNDDRLLVDGQQVQTTQQQQEEEQQQQQIVLQLQQKATLASAALLVAVVGATAFHHITGDPMMQELLASSSPHYDHVLKMGGALCMMTTAAVATKTAATTTAIVSSADNGHDANVNSRDAPADPPHHTVALAAATAVATSSMRERAEQMAVRMHEMSQLLLQQMAGSSTTTTKSQRLLDRTHQQQHHPDVWSTAVAVHQPPPLPWTPNPYEHWPASTSTGSTAASQEVLPDATACKDGREETISAVESNAVSCKHKDGTSSPRCANDDVLFTDEVSGAVGDASSSSTMAAIPKIPRKMPSGCVGAYSRAIYRASRAVAERIKEQRKANFAKLPEWERLQLSTAFIDACCSDDSLPIVKDMVQRRKIIDVEGFYVGSDGTETCALHAAAFHGCSQTIEFLCRGLDAMDPEKDGGLCDVNLQDGNGWTAMHFAAGANAVEAVRVLAQQHGAALHLEAANGYTPLQWANRLQNEPVAEELRLLLAAQDEEKRRLLATLHGAGWIVGGRHPFTAIASRFLALIPTPSM